MFKDFNIEKIDKFIKEKFPIIYDYPFEGIVLLYGGAIRDTFMNKEINDLDFVILSQGKDQIEDFIFKYNLSYKKNIFNGYKINYNNIEIDIFTTDDILDVAIYGYDTDLLLYDINMHLILPCSPVDTYKNRKITAIDNSKLIYNRKRIKKLISFIKYITKSNKHVKVKQNYPYIIYTKIKRGIKKKIKNSNLIKSYKFLEGTKKEFKIIIFLGLIISLIAAITPMLSGHLVETILSKGISKVIFIIILMIILKGLKIIISFFIGKLYLKIKKTMVFNIRKEAFSNILDFEINNFNINNSGSFINKVKDDSNEIANCFNKIKDIIIKGIGNIGIIIYIFYLNWLIGLTIVLFSYIIYKIRMIGIKKKLEAKRKILNKQEKYASMINEMITGIKDIKTLDLKDNYMSMTIEKFKEVSEIELTGDNYENKYNKIADFVQFSTIGIILILGIYLIKKNILLPSTLVIIYMYRTNIFNFLDNLISLMDTKLNFDLSCLRIFSLLDNNNYKKEKYGNKLLPKSTGIIEFKNVSFAYNKKYILNNCSFKTSKYDTIAIMGESGVGKTTILNLISKMYTPQKGKVLIDNNDINELSYKYIKDTISLVSQNPYLFDLSIKDNLLLVKPNATDEEIKDICKKVCLDKFIESLPEKYDTVIGEGGATLSQGQKQRLGIARAILKNTPIILLDEITSALDKDTGRNIKKLIDNIKNDHTIILVSHNIPMNKGYKTLTLKNGKLK